ncbi:GNAT family N-acetyltransferase [Catellatospora citrea]|uniref:GNAT family N-acetyltransferase n=1 Tax=Catellatospora citrea TaxID=53366 RepID=UPI0033FDD30D
MSAHQVRPVRTAELPALVAVELAADRVFDAIGVGPLPPPGSVEELAAAACVLVVGDPPVGFARLGRVDGQAHLEQLSVHPDHSGRGVGTALLDAACDWAARSGHREVTLTTFADIAWNGPFYAGRGFIPVTDPGPGLREIRRHESALGLDALGPRIAMRRPL